MRGIGEHLRACADCRLRESELRRTKSLVRGLPDPALPSAEFWAAAYRRLRTDDRRKAAAKRPLREARPFPALPAPRLWAAAAAAVAVGLFSAVPFLAVPFLTVRQGGSLPLHAPAAGIVRSAPVPSLPDISPDVSSLAEMHTDSVSCLPLADPDRQKMIAAEARQGAPGDAPEAAGSADASF